MISITHTKSKLETNLEAINYPLTLVENSARNVAFNLNQAMDIFWNLPDDELLEVLNSKGPVAMNEIFTAHARNAQSINDLLADRGIEPICLIGMRKEIIVNEQGLFELVPLPVIEIEE